jgi:hypothetical protein
MTRRRLVQLLLAAFCLPKAAPSPAAPPRGFHLVDGWILTDADLAALKPDDR